MEKKLISYSWDSKISYFHKFNMINTVSFTFQIFFRHKKANILKSLFRMQNICPRSRSFSLNRSICCSYSLIKVCEEAQIAIIRSNRDQTSRKGLPWWRNTTRWRVWGNWNYRWPRRNVNMTLFWTKGKTNIG